MLSIPNAVTCCHSKSKVDRGVEGPNYSLKQCWATEIIFKEAVGPSEPAPSAINGVPRRNPTWGNAGSLITRAYLNGHSPIREKYRTIVAKKRPGRVVCHNTLLLNKWDTGALIDEP